MTSVVIPITSEVSEPVTHQNTETSENITSEITQIPEFIITEITEISEPVTHQSSETSENLTSEVTQIPEFVTTEITEISEPITHQSTETSENITSEVTQIPEFVTTEITEISEPVTHQSTETSENITSEITQIPEFVATNVTETSYTNSSISTELTTQIVLPTSKKFRCETSGYFPNKNSPHVYYFCEYFATIHKCLSYEKFDPYSGKCIFDQSIKDPALNFSQWNHLIQCKKEGTFISPYNCKYFYSCVPNGAGSFNIYFNVCFKPGFVFDNDGKLCIYKTKRCNNKLVLPDQTQQKK